MLGFRPISLALLLVLPGCGDPDGLNLASVRGKVYLNGKPAAAGFVVFETDPASGDAGPPAMGQILEGGTYVLTTRLSGDGRDGRPQPGRDRRLRPEAAQGGVGEGEEEMSSPPRGRPPAGSATRG